MSFKKQISEIARIRKNNKNHNEKDLNEFSVRASSRIDIIDKDLSYVENVLACIEQEYDDYLEKIYEKPNDLEWTSSSIHPHVVNAYYHMTRNEIVFPAAILQAPLFDINQ